MPKSKHRKSQPSKRRQPLIDGQTKLPIEKLRIRRHKFAELRNNDHFVEMVKVGRALNAVLFGIDNISLSQGKMTPAESRQHHKGIFVTAGYLYEGLLLIESLHQKYSLKEYFNGFSELIKKLPLGSRERKILKTLRDSIGFHLDHEDKSTRTTIGKLKLKEYVLLSQTSNMNIDFYFDFADTTDLNFVVDGFPVVGQTEDEVLFGIISCVLDQAKEFTTSAHKFISGLAEEMNFHQYLD